MSDYYTTAVPMISDYKTTPDHFDSSSHSSLTRDSPNNGAYDRSYDSGFGSTVHSSGLHSASSYYSNNVDTDGRTPAEFDSGRGPPANSSAANRYRGSKHQQPERSNSAFVSGMTETQHGGKKLLHQQLGRSSSAFVPAASSYHTHPPDNRHPKQEMITSGSRLPPSVGGNVTKIPHGVAGRDQPANSHLDTNQRQQHPPSLFPNTQQRYEQRQTQQHGAINISGGLQKRSVSPRSVSPQFEGPLTMSLTGKEKIKSNPYPYNDDGFVESGSSVLLYKQPVPKAKTVPVGLSASKRFKFVKRSIDMSNSRNRESSFVNQYPVWCYNIVYFLLVANGFFYTGQEDVVKCFACSVVLDDWKRDDDIALRHFIANPNCPHLRKHSFATIINEICPKLFSQYSDLSSRYDSFRYWPIRCLITEGQMAEAGFFYENNGTITQCYCCGIVKDNWKDGDDPITTHMNLSPNCPYVIELMTQQTQQINYSTLEGRMKSFKHISSDSIIDIEEFAKAGFVLLRLPHTVKCFDCGLVIENWEKGEDPLIKHTKKSFECKFLQSLNRPSPVVKKRSLVDQQYLLEDSDIVSESLIQYPPSYSNQYSRSSSSGGSISLPSRQTSRQTSMDSVTSSVGSATGVSFNRSKSMIPAPPLPNDEGSDDGMCVVCFENSKECAIIPCGHLCVCKSCADRLDYCPICRRPKEDILKIYIP